MQEINGQWIMSGVDRDDPACLHNVRELTELIEAVGFWCATRQADSE